MAAAKSAQHRLMRGVWTNVRFGDMRRALAGTIFFRLVSYYQFGGVYKDDVVELLVFH